MKILRKLLVAIMLMSILMLLSACAGKTQAVTLYLKTDNGGLGIEEYLTLHSKGDMVERIVDDVTFELSSFDEETKKMFIEYADEMLAKAKSIEGVEGIGGVEGDKYVISISYPIEKEILDALGEIDFAVVSGNGNNISLEQSIENLKANGYTEAER